MRFYSASAKWLPEVDLLVSVGDRSTDLTVSAILISAFYGQQNPKQGRNPAIRMYITLH